jgi:pyruvate formate lyase activating enzyme
MRCGVCFRHCDLKEGELGDCLARKNVSGSIVSDNYGLVSSIALDPIEKKPLAEFHPGSLILSVGSYGCNLHCPFCQNAGISQENLKKECRHYTVDELIDLAEGLKPRGNIGIAFTYNEPMVSYEFVRDAAREAKRRGLLTVLVTNGEFPVPTLNEVLPYIDAMNIDLKGFSDAFYSWVGGSLKTVKEFISLAAEHSHVELTTLVIPGKNDSPEMMDEEARWIASLDPEIPLHITRYFPAYRCEIGMTPVATLKTLRDVAKRHLSKVYLGNV